LGLEVVFEHTAKDHIATLLEREAILWWHDVQSFVFPVSNFLAVKLYRFVSAEDRVTGLFGHIRHGGLLPKSILDAPSYKDW
jgi:hypothetical protein